MVTLRNTGPDAVSLNAPEGMPGAATVAAGATVDVDGQLVKPPTKKQLDEGATPLPEDAILVELPGGDRRAYSTDRWELAKGDD